MPQCSFSRDLIWMLRVKRCAIICMLVSWWGYVAVEGMVETRLNQRKAERLGMYCRKCSSAVMFEALRVKSVTRSHSTSGA
jgi:hypothetical protein